MPPLPLPLCLPNSSPNSTAPPYSSSEAPPASATPSPKHVSNSVAPISPSPAQNRRHHRPPPRDLSLLNLPNTHLWPRLRPLRPHHPRDKLSLSPRLRHFQLLRRISQTKPHLFRPCTQITLDQIYKSSIVRFNGSMMLAKLLASPSGSNSRYIEMSPSSSMTFTGGSTATKPPPGWSTMAPFTAAKEDLTRALAVDLKPDTLNPHPTQ